jgi:hypothetical protein
MNTHCSIVINDDKTPKAPHNASIEKHKSAGQIILTRGVDGLLYIGGKEVQLHATSKQTNMGIVTGFDLVREVKSKTVFSANVVDELTSEENKKFIPEAWKTYANGNTNILFPATTFSLDGKNWVKGIYLSSDKKWMSHIYALSNPLADEYFVAFL